MSEQGPVPVSDGDAAGEGRPARRSRRGTGAVTLHDVARLAGVAPITASRAINHPDQVSDAVRERVAEAIARTGYVPNLLAGGLASQRSRLVAAVVPTLSGPVFLPTIEALTQALSARGYQLMLGQSGYEGGREDDLVEAIIGRRPDGVVLTGVDHSELLRRRLRAAGIPVVETWDLTPEPIDMLVGFSHAAVGRAAAEHLASRGHRQLAVVGGTDPRAEQRTSAFVACAAERGLPPVPVLRVKPPTTLRAGRDALAAWANQGAVPSAVFCSSDLLALGVLMEAQHRGLQVPQQVAVLGFGGMDFGADTSPALSTVRIDAAAIGRLAADNIVNRAEGREAGPRVADIGFEIVVREST